MIKKAENLTLLQDRLQACTDLYRAYKKAKGADAAVLKERLFYFSKNYYTDKGFQSFLAGKELLEKEKYQEALDKFTEADEYEKSNTEVLHYLSLASLWAKKKKEAAEVNMRAMQINPLDEDLKRDKLAIEIALELWSDALLTADTLSGSFQDSYFKAVALMKTAKLEEAKKLFEQILTKEKNYPEVYYYLNELQVSKEDQKNLVKYNELCKKKKLNLRDPLLCSRAKEKPL